MTCRNFFHSHLWRKHSVLYFLEKGSLGEKQGGRKKENSKNIFFSHDPPIFQLLAAVRNGISKVGLPLNCPSGARRGNSSCAAILHEQASSTRQKRWACHQLSLKSLSLSFAFQVRVVVSIRLGFTRCFTLCFPFPIFLSFTHFHTKT